MLRILLSLSILFSFSSSMALTQTLSLAENDQLFIEGVSGQVVVEGADKDDVSIQVKALDAGRYADMWQPVIQRQRKGVLVSISGPSTKSDWQRLDKNYPRFQVLVRGKPSSLEINWRQGDIQISKWTAPVKVSQVNGKAVVKDCKGTLSLHLVKGQIALSNHSGQVDIETYGANTKIDQLTGPLSIKNFSGDSVVSNNNGSINFEAFRGVTKIVGGKGRLGFHLGEGRFEISKFEGAVDGNAETGRVILKAVNETKTKLRADEGRITVYMPKNSGAGLDIATAEGGLFVPYGQNVRHLPKLKWVKGSLRGSKNGYLFVRTKTGPINIKLY
jgi:hypothetical protein